ncbi:hypothetical protein [Flammeovirga aprica]|uniref:Uncharacterized protein n=1 Tax=Flammeovirga aprica JL-4 TaxID=694437 RepID=A0A7X9RUX4_9BACT|nr:hypothetical protein [Flammeovirga aprica]NME69165.1 hypothetical protein [Flammeovirga aprica JL-4]
MMNEDQINNKINGYISRFWSVYLPKNDQTIEAFRNGVKIGFQNKDKNNLVRVEKRDLIPLFEYINNHWNTTLLKSKIVTVAFLKGYDLALRPSLDSSIEEYADIRTLFATYIYKQYKIRHFSWESSIDTYAYRNGLDWINSFKILFNEFIDSFVPFKDEIMLTRNRLEYDIIAPESEFEIDYNQYDLPKEKFTSIVVEGHKIKEGTILELGDLLGEDYKRTVHYNIQVTDPLWDIYEKSEKDFQYVKLCHIEESHEILQCMTFDRLRRVCSGFRSIVKHIRKRNGEYYVYTNDYEIAIANAFRIGEVKVVSEYNQIDIKRNDFINDYFQKNAKEYCYFLEESLDQFYSTMINGDGGYFKFEWVNYSSYFVGWKEHKTKAIKSYIKP